MMECALCQTIIPLEIYIVRPLSESSKCEFYTYCNPSVLHYSYYLAKINGIHPVCAGYPVQCALRTLQQLTSIKINVINEAASNAKLISGELLCEADKSGRKFLRFFFPLRTRQRRGSGSGRYFSGFIIHAVDILHRFLYLRKSKVPAL